MNNKIVILYSDVKREFFSTESQFITEIEVKDRAFVIGEYLTKMNFEVFVIPANDSIFSQLKKINPFIVFNLVDSVRGVEKLASTVPAILSFLDIPHTGTDFFSYTTSTNRFLVNKVLEQGNINIPRYQLFTSPGDSISKNLSFPLICKLNSIHGSIEMGKASIVESEKELRERITYLQDKYGDNILVSEYIEGKEIATIALDPNDSSIYAAERVFDSNMNEKYHVASFDVVWGDEPDRFHYEKHEAPVELKKAISEAYKVLDVEDYVKFDTRLSTNGKYYIIDSNPNCCLGPKELECDIGTILDLYGISFKDLLSRIIRNKVPNHINNSQNGEAFYKKLLAV